MGAATASEMTMARRSWKSSKMEREMERERMGQGGLEEGEAGVVAERNSKAERDRGRTTAGAGATGAAARMGTTRDPRLKRLRAAIMSSTANKSLFPFAFASLTTLCTLSLT